MPEKYQDLKEKLEKMRKMMAKVIMVGGVEAAISKLEK